MQTELSDEEYESIISIGNIKDPLPNIKFTRRKMRVENISNDSAKQIHFIPVLQPISQYVDQLPKTKTTKNQKSSRSKKSHSNDISSISKKKMSKPQRIYKKNFEEYIRDTK